MRFKFSAVNGDLWSDVERLFGPRGACAGCWCMYWRLSKSTFETQKGERNKRAFRKLVDSGPAGILAYDKDAPVGWCAIAPRSAYPRLESSRILAPVDDCLVWAITCLFVARTHRNQGLSTALIEEAVRFAGERGASIVEGYPYAPKDRVADAFTWTGLESSFLKAGFQEVARRSAVRPIMRRHIQV